MEGLPEDTGDGSMLCTEHPFKNNTPAGGICAFCLQEKLGKLVSSSFPIAVFPSSSSSSPSFRSDSTTTTIASTVIPPPRFTNSTSLSGSNTTNNCHYHQSNRSRILYLLKKKKKKDLNITVNINAGGGGGGDGQVHDRNKNLVFKRSKSTAAPRHYNMEAENDDVLNTPNKRGFWSFLHLQQKPSHSSSFSSKTLTGISSNSMRASRQHKDIIALKENECNESNESPRTTSFDRKVSRSRSVGCGSRSFSGDFFERISTGFGDCTLRRVESQREGKVKVNTMNGGRDCIQERVRCGGLFSGFMITSSSSSSSSSSNWVGSNANEGSGGNVTGKVTSAVAGGGHGRSRSWGWALASPMRAFSKPSSSSSSSKRKNANPNLAAIPSLLSVSS